MKYTKNYNFKKPEPYDTRNINDINDSFDLVDAKLKETQDKNVNLDETFKQLIIDKGNSNAEIVASRRDKINNKTHNSLPDRLDSVSSQLAQIENIKVNKDEIVNGMRPKGSVAYASLPTTGNNAGDYYYCSDGDGTNPPGNYAWNGLLWYFAGTGDDGYNKVKQMVDSLDNKTYEIITTGSYILSLQSKWKKGLINSSGSFSANEYYMVQDSPVTNNFIGKTLHFDTTLSPRNLRLHIHYYDQNKLWKKTEIISNFGIAADYKLLDYPYFVLMIQGLSVDGVLDLSFYTYLKINQTIKSADSLKIDELLIETKKSFKNKLLEIGLNIDNFCNKAKKAIITWVDDDTSYNANVQYGIEAVKNIADNLGIKCTFGCITNKLSDYGLLEKLKSYQEQGFQITSHSHTHTKDFWYGASFNLDLCEEDLIKSLITLRSNGFLNYDDFIIPGGKNDNALSEMISKYCRCAVLSNVNNGINHLASTSRYRANRIFIKPNSLTFDEYKSIIDSCYANADWLIFGTHSGITSEWDADLITNVLQYAIDKGIEIQTLNSALKNRMPYYTMSDIFS